MTNFQDNENIFFDCPHCEENFTLKQTDLFNNIIYRHGILKSTGKWINPYMSNLLCDRYLINKKISGCGKHFKVIYNGNNYDAIKYNVIK